MEVDSSFFKSMRVDTHTKTHTSLATIIVLVIEKKIEEEKNPRRKRKLVKEIYTCIDRDPLTRKKKVFVDINYFLLLYGFEQQLMAYKISNGKRKKKKKKREKKRIISERIEERK